MDRGMKIGIGGLVVVGALAAIGQLAGDDGDEGPGRQLTPTAAACQMLADGDTAEEAYDVLLDLDIRPTTASRAVNRAVAGDC
jgi:hypothetical protein